MTTHTPPAQGSGRTVTDYLPFCEGDTEPTLNKRIHTLIDCDATYIVYLDDDLKVEWSTVPSYQFVDGFSAIANEMARLETAAVGRLRSTQNPAFARLLGEAMARIIGDRDATKAHDSLANASAYLAARGLENARSWHVRAASVVSVVAAIAFFVLFAARSSVATSLGDGAVAILLGTLCGAFGALLSIVMRFKDLDVNAAAGPFIHILEGVARILTGTLGALLISLGVRANLVFGFVNTLPHPFAAFLAVCIVSGASERIVPSFIEHMEQKANPATHKKGAT